MRERSVDSPRSLHAPSVAPLFCLMLAACGSTRALILGAAQLADAGLLLPDAGLVDAAFEEGGPTDGGAPCDACSVVVMLLDATATAEQGGSTGAAFFDTCPGDQAVIGYQGFLAPPSVGLLLVGGIQAACAVLSPPSAPNGRLLAAPSGAMLPLRGTSQSAAWTQMCPKDEVVVGFRGGAGAALDAVAFECAPWFAPGGDDAGSFSMGPTDAQEAVGGDGGSSFDAACPPGQLARGSAGRSGSWVDAFGLICGTPFLSRDGGSP